MEKFIAFIFIVLIIILIGLITGIILWLIWPIVIPNVFPALVEKGIINGHIDLIPAIFLTLICAILIKSKSISGK